MCTVSTLWERKALDLFFDPKVGKREGEGELEAGCKYETPRIPRVGALELAGRLLAASCSSVFYH